MINEKTKKEFQKVIGSIRNEDRKANNHKRDFPKAMMTNHQMEKETATVNCGGEWYGKEIAEYNANLVLKDQRFLSFLDKYGAKATTETNSFGAYQIRLTF